MNNILYIIVGLVIVAVIAVVILKKNKAQAPTLSKPSDDFRAAHPTSQSAPAANQTTATKFDDLTVAQRFIDQQRYDRAIETLERGLKTTPNDHQLWLKLLNVYALTKQTVEFYNTYQTITKQADPATIHEAQQLKGLFDAEQGFNHSAAQNTEASQPEFESLDFDLEAEKRKYATRHEPLTQQSIGTVNAATESQIETVAPNIDDTIIEEQKPLANDAFDLTLEDLEASDLELEPFAATNNISEDVVVADQNVSQDPLALSLENQQSALTEPELTFDDFDFDRDSATPEKAIQTELSHQELAQKEDDADFDFDLALDLDETKPDQAVENTAAQSNLSDTSDDFALELDDLDLDAELDQLLSESFDGSENLDDFQNSNPELIAKEETLNESTPAKEDLTLSDDDDFAMFGLEEANFNHEEAPAANNYEQTQQALTSQTEAPELLFDDETPLDNFSFNVDSSAPKSEAFIEQEESQTQPVVSTVHLNPQFSTDFALVNELNHQQITLELAEQYLELGEYDSAKRLLNEVLNEGDRQQQQQAQALLDKTA
ncbi:MULTISPECIES: FimV/HubP family polar landmark protein [Psychrobacter]|uniref:FimV/HubP family polar landmark protein n=1 Tax=Psychrobacter TaxID=497 RepID=UPI00146A2F6D|nr:MULTISPECIES: FimV/HubP family polar landmark protein [Psychrobacter]